MLNRDICQRCITDNSHDTWSFWDDDNWEEKWLHCRVNSKVFGIDEDPPKTCPYLLEHLMKDKNKC